MMTPESGEAANSIESAESFFERMLDPDSGTPGGTDHADVDTADLDESEAELADDAEDESDEQSDDPSEADADSDDDEANVLADAELDRKVPVKIDGKTVYKTVRELMQDGLRQSDYTRKTQALAEEKRQLETQAKELEAVRQERAYYQQVLEDRQRQIAAGMQELTPEQWGYLRQHDPLEYTLRKQDELDRRTAIAQAEQQKQYLQQREAFEVNKQREAVVSSEMARLYDSHPEWKNPKTWNKVRAEILDYGERIGYTADELKSATDSRAILALHKAMIADKAMSAKPVATAAGKPAPKPMPVSTVPRSRSDRDMQKAQQRLAKSGSIEDAADVFSRLI